MKEVSVAEMLILMLMFIERMDSINKTCKNYVQTLSMGSYTIIHRGQTYKTKTFIWYMNIIQV